MDWLLAPIDPTRAHEISFAVSWHGRAMVLAWGVLAPVAILVARFFKITPGQNWPEQLDSQIWWRSHWMGQSLVAGLSILGFVLVLPADLGNMSLHSWLGYAVLLLTIVQILMGVFRGSKGGPTDPGPDGSTQGDHYNMTPWRIVFERIHKGTGYALLLAAAVTILLGMWKANAPLWMWLSIGVWWAGVIAAGGYLQHRGMAIDTYQAIWGPDQTHPGNNLPSQGWGMRRPGDKMETKDVRSDRGHRVRSN